MNRQLLISVILTCCAAALSAQVRAEIKPKEFSACMKRTEHDRANCQSGCGMILQQCYDEADDALEARTSALLSKPRTVACTELGRKYADGAAQLADAVVAESEAQPGWLSAELKMQLMQQRYSSVKLIDEMCK